MAQGACSALVEAHRLVKAEEAENLAARVGAGGGGAALALAMVGCMMSISNAVNATARERTMLSACWFMFYLQRSIKYLQRPTWGKYRQQRRQELALGCGATFMAAMYALAVVFPSAMLHTPAPAIPPAALAEPHALPAGLPPPTVNT